MVREKGTYTPQMDGYRTNKMNKKDIKRWEQRRARLEQHIRELENAYQQGIGRLSEINLMLKEAKDVKLNRKV